jgi:hypothetical protein
MRPDVSSPAVVRAMANLYQRRGVAWRALQGCLMPLVILLWLYYWFRLRATVRGWLRRQAAGLNRWRQDRDDRIMHPEKYRGLG